MANPFHEVAPQSGASTSSSQKSYDVFINHRGKDTKLTVASIIYHMLNGRGVRAFLDQEELDLGDSIPQALQNAICSASVHIAIFSAEYAESPWCLEELSLMDQTNVTIIPVFYHVQPSDLRQEKGKYADALRALQEKRSGSKRTRSGRQTEPRYSPEKIEEWKQALSHVSYRSGAILFDDKCDHGELYMKILETTLHKIKKVPLEVAPYPVGLDNAVQHFQNTIGSSIGSINVQIVGIVGMGGSGKTTLAKELYNRECSSFSRSSFLSDVKDVASKNTLHNLQKKLIKDFGMNLGFFENTHEGTGILAACSISQKVLIVLDNVDDVDQILALLPLRMMDKLGRGSMIIVTTREKKVLQNYWRNSTIFQMKLLDHFNAKQLFCRHAFPPDMSHPSSQLGFEDLIERFVKACKGLPLSLKVFGGMVNGFSEEYWEYQLLEVEKELPDQIGKHLKLSYDALDRRVQQMFLDVACFFTGEKKSFVVEIWDGSGWSGEFGWENLVNKCLIELDKDGKIEMHDHLRDLGRKIAGDALPSRVWKEEHINNLDGTTPIRGIVFRDMSRNRWSTLGIVLRDRSSTFQHCIETIRPSLHALQPLKERVINFIKEFAADLVWLHLDDFNELEHLPSRLYSKNLRVLELYDARYLQVLWQDNVQPPLQLRVLIIKHARSLRGLPRSIGHLRYLKKVVLSGGSGSDMRLPEEFCNLEALEILELSGFPYLSSLPGDFGKLRNLRSLSLWRLGGLTALPDSFKLLTALQSLYISSCWNLMFSSDMLHVLEFMKELQELTIDDCPRLESPHLTAQVSSLRKLTLGTGLRQLPNNIGQLTRLETLAITSDNTFKILPGSLGEFSCLTSLRIEGCEMSESLSEAFGGFSNLRDLYIGKTTMVELGLETGACNLRSLKSLSLVRTGVCCISISDDCCPSLETFFLLKNNNSTDLETLPRNVRDIQVERCSELKSMRGIGDLLNLRRLVVRDCPELEVLPCPTYMHSIGHEIYIKGCPKINISNYP